MESVQKKILRKIIDASWHVRNDDIRKALNPSYKRRNHAIYEKTQDQSRSSHKSLRGKLLYQDN